MSKKLLIIILIIMVGMIWFVLRDNSQGKIVAPGFSQNSKQTPTPSNAPPQAPKTFQFDASTDLKAELEKINPQVLDSDFNE